MILLKATNPTIEVKMTILCALAFEMKLNLLPFSSRKYVVSIANNGTRNAEYWNTRLFMLRLEDSKLIVNRGRNGISLIAVDLGLLTRNIKNAGATNSTRYSRFDVVSNCADSVDMFSGIELNSNIESELSPNLLACLANEALDPP